MNNPSRLLSFGPFQLDLRTRELRKHGIRIRLQAQPFQVLEMLLSRPGVVVTREEIKRTLWPEDTFGSFDHGLNKAINKIREALADSATLPRYIETVARSGYRFIEAVTTAGESTHDPLAAPISEAKDGGKESQGKHLTDRARRKSFAWTIAGACLALSAIWLTLFIWRPESKHRQSSDIRSLAVLPLENLSSDTAQEYFADGMTDELISALGTINGLRVISRTSVMLYKHARKPLPEIARELNADAG